MLRRVTRKLGAQSSRIATWGAWDSSDGFVSANRTSSSKSRCLSSELPLRKMLIIASRRTTWEKSHASRGLRGGPFGAPCRSSWSR